MAKYAAFFLLAFSLRLRNYKLLLGLSFFMVACLLVFAHIWEVAESRTAVPFFSSGQLLWYLAFNQWLLISIPEVEMEVEEDLRSGRFAYLLTRPVSYLGMKFAEGLGTLSIQLLVLGAVGFCFTWYWTGGTPCCTPLFFLALPIGFLAGILGVALQILIGLAAFWFHEVGPIQLVVQKLLFVFGGLFIPLAAYPDWLQNIALFTPFPALLGGRSALIMSNDYWQAAWVAFSIALWLVITCSLMRLLYKKGLRILNTEGG